MIGSHLIKDILRNITGQVKTENGSVPFVYKAHHRWEMQVLFCQSISQAYSQTPKIECEATT